MTAMISGPYGHFVQLNSKPEDWHRSTVKPGDCLWDDALNYYGLTTTQTLTPTQLKKVDAEMEAIESANPQLQNYGPNGHGSFNLIYPGEHLYLPNAHAPAGPPQAWKEGTVLYPGRDSIPLGHGYALSLGPHGVLYLDKAGMKNPIWASDANYAPANTTLHNKGIPVYPTGISVVRIADGNIYLENSDHETLLTFPINSIPHLTFDNSTGYLTASG